VPQYNILNRGFKNVSQNGQVSGFKIDVMSDYYRGVYVTLIEGFDVTVDGKTFARNQVRCTFGNKTYTQEELQKLSDVRWQWDEPVTLLVSKPGGLEPGMHDVQVVAKLRISYMPVQPSVFDFKARIPLVG
jgi:hypothetical protein